MNLGPGQLVDWVNSNPNHDPAVRRDGVDAGGFRDSQPMENLAVEPIPRRRGSVLLETPNAPNAKLYSMNGEKRGKALIFNHVSFFDPEYLDRHGTEKDVERLYNVLPRFGFQTEDIEVYEDLSCSEITRTAVRRE